MTTFIAVGLSAGPIVGLLLLGGAMAWLAWRSIKGHEVARRIVFAMIALAVTIPLLFPITFQSPISPVVKAVFDQVEKQKPGSTVLISFDFDPAMAPEIQPMANAVTRHCLSKGLKVVFMSLWGTGPGQLRVTLDNVVAREFPNLKQGEDWANIGYKAGNQGVLNVIVTDLHKMYPADVNNTPLENLPIFKDIKSCKDFSLVIALGGGLPGPKEWVLFVGDPGDVPVVAGASAVTAPQLYPYYPKQLLGIMGGVKGAAEYEQHLGEVYAQFESTPKPAVTAMGPQTLAHMVVMIFIVIGNIVYFRSRREAAKG